jgi:hypothetical protein
MGDQQGDAVTAYAQQAIESGDFEAVWGGPRADRQTREFVVYDHTQVYPEYVVYYQIKSA